MSVVIVRIIRIIHYSYVVAFVKHLYTTAWFIIVITLFL